MKKTNVLLVLLLLFVSGSAYADTKFLKCQSKDIKTNEKIEEFNVSLNESTGRITHSFKGNTNKADGFFTANSIKYKYTAMNTAIAKVVYQHEINRNNLKITTEINITSKYTDPKTMKYLGSCSVITPQNRKI